MGCRIPLTGTDMRHHPGKNFEKPFVSWLKRFVERRKPPPGWGAVCRARSRANRNTRCEVRTNGARPGRCGSGRVMQRTSAESSLYYEDCGLTRHWPVCGPLPPSSVTCTRTTLE